MSGKFSKSGLSRNRTFSIPDAGLLTLLKIEKNPIFFSNFFFKIFFCLFTCSKNFWHYICIQGPYLMRINNLYLVRKMFKSRSPDSVRSSKFGCPVLSGQETHMPSPVEPYLFAQCSGQRVEKEPLASWPHFSWAQ